MQSTVANPSDYSVNVGPSLPTGNVTVISGQERCIEVRTSAPLRLRPAIQKNNNALLIPHFKEFVGFLIGSDVPEIHAVLMHQEDNILRVYIATKAFDFDINERIYDREEQLMNLFENVDFDFHIIGPRRFGDPTLKVVYSR